MTSQFKILDCTLRDGGYYNNWDFSKDLVNDYLKTMSLVGVDCVELGFRSFQTKDFKGPTWYTTDSYLECLSIPKNLIVGVMVNVSELISHPSGFAKATRLMFAKAKKSKVKLVRLACHFEEFNQAPQPITYDELMRENFENTAAPLPVNFDDTMGQCGTDALAYYLPFHGNANWGIYILDAGVDILAEEPVRI